MSRLVQRAGVLVSTALLALTLTGAVGAARDDLDLVSVATGVTGAQGNSTSLKPAISADGRFVAFESTATNLDPADPTDSKFDVYLRDLQASTTKLASRATGLAGAKGNDDSLDPSVSADGRFVAFSSAATNLDPADNDR